MVFRALLMATAAFGLAVASPSARSQTAPSPSARAAGQLNQGAADQPPSATPPAPIADHEDVRAALLMADPGTISTGGSPDASGTAQPGTTGTGITGGEGPGPIGSTMQTKPAKFSHRNDAIDHTPTMGMPFRLDAQQRERVFQAVMADDAPTLQNRNFKPADALPYALTSYVRPLPLSLDDMPGLKKLDYIKGKNAVYLVTDATAIPIVVDILQGS
jgi:hypothetical protein